MSKIQVDEIVNKSGDGDSGFDLSTNDKIGMKIADSEVVTVDTTGVVVNENSADRDFRVESNGQTDAIFVNAGDDITNFFSTTTVNSAGDNTDDGVSIRSDGRFDISRASAQPLNIRRRSSDGLIISFYKEASGSTTNVGSIQVQNTDNLSIQGNSSHCGLEFGGDAIFPHKNSANVDNQIDLGEGTLRFDDIHATNGTIQTSDENEKEDIASATTKELNVAKKLSTLFKTFRWKDKVAEKGDKARTHTGIIAQEVQSAFSAEGLDASKYGLFTSNTWWEKEVKVDAVKADEEKGIEAKDAYTYMDIKYEKTDGYTERTRLGVRYPELFSFIFSSIEARLTALESN